MVSASKFHSVFMAGGGFMGSAIAFLIASKTDAKVYVYDISQEQLAKSSASVDKFGKSSQDKGFITADDFADLKKRI